MAIELKKYTHIIWDWNGTLLDDAWLCVDVMNGMLKERSMALKTVDEYRDMFDFPVKEYYVKLGYDFEKESFDDVGLEFIQRYTLRRNESSLHNEVHEVLTRLASMGYSQNILSAREQSELIAETKTRGIYTIFDRIRGLDDHYAHGKTGAGIQLMKEIKAEPKDILFIGDTRHDAEVAAELGIDCILIANGHQSADRLLKLGVPVINSLSDLN
jgi:phosphoglycolate phosphatase